MAAASMAEALILFKQVIMSVSGVPGTIVHEVIGGNTPFNAEGVFLLSVRERYEYATRPPIFPTSAQADILLAIQLSRRSLDVIAANLPVSALTRLSGAIRAKIEERNTDGTFRNFEPGMEVTLTRSEPLFAEQVDYGVLELEFLLAGYDRS